MGSHPNLLSLTPFTLMAELKMKQYRKLQSLGAEPIPRPSDINFADNLSLQKTPGRHHRPEFRECGTYLHPNLIAYRLRVAKDRIKRFDAMIATDTEMKKYSSNRTILEDNVRTEQKNLRETINGKTPIGKILRSEERDYPYRIVGMDYVSILEDFEEAEAEDHDVQVTIQKPEIVDETVEERTVIDVTDSPVNPNASWEEVQAMSDRDMREFCRAIDLDVHHATGRDKRLEAIREKLLGAEPVNPNEPDDVAKAAAAATSTPREDLSSDDE